ERARYRRDRKGKHHAAVVQDEGRVRSPVHGQRRGARPLDARRRLPGRGRQGAVAHVRLPPHRQHGRPARPALPGQRGAALLRRGAFGQHRGLHDLRVRPDGAPVERGLPARGKRRHRARLAAAARVELPVLPGGRQDRRPLLPRFPELLQRRGLLRHRVRVEPGDAGGGARALLLPGVRPHPLRVPDADRDLQEGLAHAHGALARQLRGDPVADARSRALYPVLLGPLPLLLLRPEPLPLGQDARGPPHGGAARGV
ncbi:MAG: Phosphatidylcholine synthase, partial [uncultured Rubrobacteraceae bacterium]